MGEIAKWGGHSFAVKPNLIRGFTDLSIKGGSATENKESGGQGFVTRKSGSPTQVTLTAELYAMTGADVKKEAMQYVKEATEGKTDFLYIGGSKATNRKMMLTDANADEIAIAPNGTWVSCKVKLTLKEYGEAGGGGGSGGGGGGGGAKKTMTAQQRQELVARIKKEARAKAAKNSASSKKPQGAPNGMKRMTK